MIQNPALATALVQDLPSIREGVGALYVTTRRATTLDPLSLLVILGHLDHLILLSARETLGSEVPAAAAARARGIVDGAELNSSLVRRGARCPLRERPGLAVIPVKVGPVVLGDQSHRKLDSFPVTTVGRVGYAHNLDPDARPHVHDIGHRVNLAVRQLRYMHESVRVITIHLDKGAKFANGNDTALVQSQRFWVHPRVLASAAPRCWYVGRRRIQITSGLLRHIFDRKTDLGASCSVIRFDLNYLGKHLFAHLQHLVRVLDPPVAQL